MKYSIVIITADRENILKKCIDKLFEYGVNLKAEIIIVDASKETFQHKKLDQVKYIKILPNEKGFSNQRNIGIKNTFGRYIIFIDDDIEITPDWFDTFTFEFEKHKDDFLAAMGAVFPKETNIISFITGVLGHPGGGFRMYNFAKNENIFISQVATCNTILNKEIIENVGFFDISNKYGSEDSDFSIRVIKKYGENKFIYIPNALVWHYSPDNFIGFVKWYIRRGMSDADLFLAHKTHWNYFFRTLVSLKILIVLILTFMINIKLLFGFFLLWYLLILYKYRFMSNYFKFYNFNFFFKIFIFFSFPFFKAIADGCFDFGRIKRILNENFIH